MCIYTIYIYILYIYIIYIYNIYILHYTTCSWISEIMRTVYQRVRSTWRCWGDLEEIWAPRRDQNAARPRKCMAWHGSWFMMDPRRSSRSGVTTSLTKANPSKDDMTLWFPVWKYTMLQTPNWLNQFPMVVLVALQENHNHITRV